MYYFVTLQNRVYEGLAQRSVVVQAPTPLDAMTQAENEEHHPSDRREWIGIEARLAPVSSYRVRLENRSDAGIAAKTVLIHAPTERIAREHAIVAVSEGGDGYRWAVVHVARNEPHIAALQHSPGPWTWNTNRSDPYDLEWLVAADGTRVLTIYGNGKLKLNQHLIGAATTLYGALMDHGEGRLAQYEPGQTCVDRLLRHVARYLADLGGDATTIRMLEERAAVVRAAVSFANGADAQPGEPKVHSITTTDVVSSEEGTSIGAGVQEYPHNGCG